MLNKRDQDQNNTDGGRVQAPKDGIHGVDFNIFEIYVNGQQLANFSGPVVQAQKHYAKLKREIEASPDKLFMNTPIEDIPADFWLNGDVEPITPDRLRQMEWEAANPDDWNGVGEQISISGPRWDDILFDF